MKIRFVIPITICVTSLSAPALAGTASRESKPSGPDARRAAFTSVPTAITLEADSVTSSSARLRALCSPHGSPATAFFEWGRSLEPDTSSATTEWRTLEQDTADVDLTERVGPLMPGQTYYFRIWISDSYSGNHWLNGEIRSFTTASDTTALWMAIPLKIAATGTGGSTIRFGVHSYATACGDPGLGEFPLPPRPPEGSMETRFLGRCSGFGLYLDLRPYISPAQADTYRISFLAGGTGYPVTVSWPDLESFYAGPVTLQTADGTIDMMASTSYNITDPEVEDVRIIAAGPKPKRLCPGVAVDTVSALASGTVRLTATVFPHGLATTGWFEWGTTARYGNQTAPQILGDTIGPVLLTADLSGLQGNSLYHFRVIARNIAATVVGDDRLFSLPGPTQPAVPYNFALHQNYPNPFNPTTLIRYDLPVDAPVAITIFDLMGRQVRTLIDAPESAGFKSVQFDASGMPTGIYLYRITAGGFTDIKKAVVIR
jgi:type IX secretion system substrate protein